MPDSCLQAQADAEAEMRFQQQNQQHQQQRLHDDGDESPDPDDGGPETDYGGMGGMGGMGGVGSADSGGADMPRSYDGGGGGDDGEEGSEDDDDDGPEIHWEGYGDFSPRFRSNASQRSPYELLLPLLYYRCTTNVVLYPAPPPTQSRSRHVRPMCGSRHSPFSLFFCC